MQMLPAILVTQACVQSVSFFISIVCIVNCLGQKLGVLYKFGKIAIDVGASSRQVVVAFQPSGMQAVPAFIDMQFAVV